MIYTGTDTATAPRNEVVETDYNLQVFSGGFQPDPTDPAMPPRNLNLITDWNRDGTRFFNTYFQGKPNNMGGCMGCHGNAQVKGADFSFLVLGQRVQGPEVADPGSLIKLAPKYQALLRRR
jgi:hypothetical protein